MDIFILCTYSEGGRFVQAATTDPTTAGENHERLSVVHLSNDAGRWLNVEEYHTTE